jgi:GNAT superfamily N-acetyltransferase
LLEALRDGARETGLRHLSARVDAADDGAIQALETSGYLNVDALMTFSTTPGDIPPPRELDGIDFRGATAADAPALGSLAAEAFTSGRFHADPSIPPDRAQAVYRTWAASCGEATRAQATIVAAIDGRVAGFVSCRLTADTAVFLPGPAGTIPLIAVSGSARGRGVGAGLIGHAGAWFSSARASAVQVGTQIRNVPAARLYESCGFRLADSALSFRLMID